ALCRQGERERVRASWAWALERFERAGRITTTIFRGGPRDVYDFGADSLPLLLYGLREADAMTLARRHREFLAREIERYLAREFPSGDANVWPFFFGVFRDPEMAGRACSALEAGAFTRPIPLRYFERRLPDAELPIPRLFTPNYQGDTSWMQLGPAFLTVLRDVDRQRMIAHRDRVAAFIDRDRNYLELYTPDGRPYRGRLGLYRADEGMLWA